MCCVVICCLSKKYLKSVHTSIILVNKNGICMDQNIFFFLKMSLTYGKFYLSILKNTRRLRVVWGLGGRVAGWPVNKEKPIMTHGSRLCGCLWFRWIFSFFTLTKGGGWDVEEYSTIVSSTRQYPFHGYALDGILGIIIRIFFNQMVNYRTFMIQTVKCRK